MTTTISDFERTWQHEGGATLKMLRALTDASLGQPEAPGERSLGRVAWHLVLTVSEMLQRTGLTIESPAHDSPVPPSAAAIADAYDRASRSMLRQIKEGWTDATLEVEDDMYGESWKRGLTLDALILHQAHHRGQLTVLMRQAGLKVPGVYGPSHEEWAAIGMEPPAI